MSQENSTFTKMTALAITKVSNWVEELQEAAASATEDIKEKVLFLLLRLLLL